MLLRSDLFGEKKMLGVSNKKLVDQYLKEFSHKLKLGLKVSDIDGASTAAVAMGCRRNRGCLIPVLVVVAGPQVRRRQQSIHL